MTVGTLSDRRRLASGFDTLPYFVAVGLGILLGTYVAVPWLVDRGVPLLFAFTGAPYLPVALVFAVVLAIYRREGGTWT